MALLLKEWVAKARKRIIDHFEVATGKFVGGRTMVFYMEFLPFDSVSLEKPRTNGQAGLVFLRYCARL